MQTDPLVLASVIVGGVMVALLLIIMLVDLIFKPTYRRWIKTCRHCGDPVLPFHKCCCRETFIRKIKRETSDEK